MKTRIIAIALALPVLMAACASHRPATEVTEQMARTEAVIQQAERSGVAVNSLPELQAAKDKYANAKRSLEKESTEGDHAAMQLAKQAEVDAQFATAKSQSTTQETSSREVQSGVAALKDEANRNATAPAAAQ